MTPFEKHAWFNLVVFVVTLIVVVPMLFLVQGNWYLSGFALLGLWVLGPVFYPSQSLIDERIRAIQNHATRIAYWAYWVLFVLGGLAMWFWQYRQQTLGPTVIPILVLGGLVLYVLVHSGATIILHRLENWYAGS